MGTLFALKLRRAELVRPRRTVILLRPLATFSQFRECDLAGLRPEQPHTVGDLPHIGPSGSHEPTSLNWIVAQGLVELGGGPPFSVGR